MRTIRLTKGTGTEGTSHCVMAATSIVAGEAFSDKPSCVSPAITRALIIVNDNCPTDAIRERLLGHLPWLIIGTRGTLDHEIQRAQLFATYAAAAAAAAAATAYAATASAASATASARATASAATASAASATASAASAATYAASAATYAAASAATYAASADADAASAAAAAWEHEMKKFIDFIEQTIIPVYTTMPVEPGYRIEKLVTAKAGE